MSKILHNLAATRKRASEIDLENEKISNPSQKKIKLLKKPEEKAQTKKSSKNKVPSTTPSEGSSVVYLGHIAHGFYEQEIRKFFSQFGKVERLKLVRSKKTGGSRGHAFIQFESPEIAEVVAETIDGYFLHERQLVCHIVPPNKIHEGLFAVPKRKNSTSNPDENVNDNETEEIETVEPGPLSEQKLNKITRLQTRKQNRLRELGINFDFLNRQIV